MQHGVGSGARAFWVQARALEWMGQSDEARLQAIDALLKASPNHVGARLSKGRLRAAQGAHDEAEVLARQAVELPASPGELAGAWALLGWIGERQSQLARARESYEQALQLDSGHADALLGAGRVLLREGRHAEALARFEAAQRAAADTSTHGYTPAAGGRLPGPFPPAPRAPTGVLVRRGRRGG
jgi:tetratricopeptide (TPR) repeat protein